MHVNETGDSLAGARLTMAGGSPGRGVNHPEPGSWVCAKKTPGLASARARAFQGSCCPCWASGRMSFRTCPAMRQQVWRSEGQGDRSLSQLINRSLSLWHWYLVYVTLRGRKFSKVVMRPDVRAGPPGFESPGLPATRCGKVSKWWLSQCLSLDICQMGINLAPTSQAFCEDQIS